MNRGEFSDKMPEGERIKDLEKSTPLKNTLQNNAQEISKKLNEPLVRGRARGGKKLKVSGKQGARGLIGLI